MASNKFIFHQENYCQDKSTLLIFADSKSLHLQATLKHGIVTLWVLLVS